MKGGEGKKVKQLTELTKVNCFPSFLFSEHHSSLGIRGQARLGRNVQEDVGSTVVGCKTRS